MTNDECLETNEDRNRVEGNVWRRELLLAKDLSRYEHWVKETVIESVIERFVGRTDAKVGEGGGGDRDGWYDVHVCRRTKRNSSHKADVDILYNKSKPMNIVQKIGFIVTHLDK